MFFFIKFFLIIVYKEWLKLWTTRHWSAFNNWKESERKSLFCEWIRSTFFFVSLSSLEVSLIIVLRKQIPDLPLTSSSSMVVLESVDSFSFTCDPSLFFVIMLLPLHIVVERARGEKEKLIMIMRYLGSFVKVITTKNCRRELNFYLRLTLTWEISSRQHCCKNGALSRERKFLNP